MQHKGPGLIVIHPFLVFLFPLVSLFSHNVGQVHVRETLRATAAGLLATGLLLMILFLISRSWHKAGLAASWLLVLFFSFGHIYVFLHQRFPAVGVFGQANVLTAIWAAAIILGVWAALRVLPPMPGVSYALNVAGGVLILSSLVNLIVYNWKIITQDGSYDNGRTEIADSRLAGLTSDDSMPDVYYIILDGYGRQDILSEVYHLDENPLVDFLRKRGFYVAAASHSNYGQTSLSLASSLNIDYLDRLVSVGPDAYDPTLTEGLIQNSAVMRFFKARGYKIIAFETGYAFTELRQADIFYAGSKWLNHYEEMLLKNTMAVIWLDSAAAEAHRNKIRAVFDNLKLAADVPGPKFVFAHIVIPHPPFVFDRNGNSVHPSGAGDGQFYYGTRESYIEGYREQLIYANGLVEGAVSEILDGSKTPPIVIVQGDHGPGAFVNFESLEDTCIRERFSILNAYLLPNGGNELLYPEITPVNSFRVVFDASFGQDLPLLKDATYYSSWSHPFRVTEVSDRLHESCRSGQ